MANDSLTINGAPVDLNTQVKKRGAHVNGTTINGATIDDTTVNGTAQPESPTTRRPESHTATISSNSESQVSFTKDQQITILQKTVAFTCEKVTARFDVDEHQIRTTTIDDFLEYIERQRLTHVPHRGSRWDKVLKWAEFFGLQISGYARAVESFVPDSKLAAQLIWTSSKALLKLGPENDKSLETTFGVFYKLGLSLSALLRHNRLLHANSHIRLEVGQSFNSLLALVRDVSLHYHALVHGMLSDQASVDFTALFGGQIRAFHSKKSHIITEMWKQQLGEQELTNIGALRSWLKTQDSVLDKTQRDRRLSPESHDEYTCEWFQRHLLDFSRGQNDILAIFGPEGSGKTYLSRWVVERLQRPLGKKTHQTLSYTIEADNRSTTTSLAVVKSLLAQLLEKSVGDQTLFHAVTHSYNLSMRDSSVVEIEETLWKALDIGVARFDGRGNDSLVIVVDGLDELKSFDSSKAVMQRLASLAAKYSRLQAITLSRNAPHKPSQAKFDTFQIKPDFTHNDCQHIAEHAFHGYVVLHDKSEHEREAIVGKLVKAALGNVLWLCLTIHMLRRESTHDGFEKALKLVIDTAPSLHQTIANLTKTVDTAKADLNLILSWMLVAKRPLTIGEVQCLYQVDVQKRQMTDKKFDVRRELGPLVTVKDDMIRFRHSAVRDYFLGLQLQGTTKLLQPSTAQTDLTVRLLAYCKFRLTGHQEPTVDLIATSRFNELLAQHSLLEYAVRNWTNHFRASTLQSEQALQLSADFKDIFPDSNLMALLERTLWLEYYHTSRSYELAIRVRESVFSEKHECVLQSLIVCGDVFRKWSKTREAGLYFYRASRIGRAILRKHHSLAVTCATTFLSLIHTIAITTRTEIATWKEETLRFVIDVYKHQHGETHELVIEYCKQLAQLYVEIHEEHNAEVIWREVREIIIRRSGRGSEEEKSVSEQLTTVLKKGDRKTDVVEYEHGLLDIVTTLEIWDIRRVQVTLQLASSYEARKELFMAEELYITLWRKLTERCHHHSSDHGVEIHIYTIDVALEYVRFLQRCHRHEEASNILICIWTEYEEYDFESETLFLRLKIVGELMRAVSLLSVAVSVFKKCWAWFVARGKVEYSSSCEVLIKETVEEITTTTLTTISTSTTTTTTTTTETVMKELFESTLTRTEITSETISICKSLISYYMNLEQWSQAIETTRRSLSLIWTFVVSGVGTTALPHHFSAGAIDIAINLAICHHRSHHYHEAEEIYLRIYYACSNSCHVEDERFVESCKILIRFYEEHHHWHKLIQIHQKLLVQYRKTLGLSHKLVIRTLYTLGSLCTDHGHGPALEYYEDIITLLNGDSNKCHPDALDALLVVCRIHNEAGSWKKLRHVCQILWKTWTEQHDGHTKLTADVIEVIYFRYRYVLEYHEVCEHSVLRQLTLEYRNTCIKYFGAAASVTIKASIEFAEICYRNEKSIHEAISVYEEVLTSIRTTTKTTELTTVVSTTTVTKIKESLCSAYISVCTHGAVSVTTIERALTIVRERFESLKITLGWIHVETLSCLRELVLLQLKTKKQDSHTVVVDILRETCSEIIKVGRHSKALHEAAKFLGKVYVDCEMIEQGRTLIEELRLDITAHFASSKADFKVDKVSYVFLATFEQAISGHSVTYSEIMTDLLAESVLYESYYRCVKSEKDVTVILIHAARLRGFLASHHRETRKEALQKEAFEIFIKKWHSTIKRRDNISFTFYLGLLEELGKESSDVQIGNAACHSSISTVRDLLNSGCVQEAYEVANCALDFINHQHAFHHLQNVPFGLKLSKLMVGRGLETPLKADVNPKLRENMRELSRRIIREVLHACKESKIDFVRLPLQDLDDLAILLGEQQNFAALEWLLDLLWSSRESLKAWKTETILAVGRLFVEARYLNKEHRSRAIRLCEDISYNLRRVRGFLDLESLKMSILLSQLYTSMGHYREAQGVHESILRVVIEGDDDDESTVDTISASAARQHLDLLKQSFLRLKGWDKSTANYKNLVDAVIEMYKKSPEFKSVQGIEKWDFNKEKASETLGKFAAPEDWAFAKAEKEDGETNHRRVSAHRAWA